MGQPAAAAAQGVRRAGLRPGLDRSFDCDAALTGSVVAQEPQAGSELARNGMVTLYVAAPGSKVAEESRERTGSASDAGVGASAIDRESPDAQAPVASARRSRKPGLATAIGAPVSDPPPDPEIALGRAWCGGDPPLRYPPSATASDAETGTDAPRTLESAQPEPCETAHHELWSDELVVQADDVFAGRAANAPSWRRLYPRGQAAGPLRRVLAWLTRHAVLASTTCAMVAVWIAVGVLSAVGRPTAHASAAVTSRTDRAETNVARRASGTPAPSAATPPASRRDWKRPRARMRLSAPPAGVAANRRPAAAHAMRRTAVTSSRAPSASASARPEAAPAPEHNAQPVPAAQQTGGGPFSP